MINYSAFRWFMVSAFFMGTSFGLFLGILIRHAVGG